MDLQHHLKNLIISILQKQEKYCSIGNATVLCNSDILQGTKTHHCLQLLINQQLVLWIHMPKKRNIIRTTTFIESSSYFWRRIFIISAPIWASCTRGLHRSCLVLVCSTSVRSSRKLGGKNLNNNPAASSRIWGGREEEFLIFSFDWFKPIKISR